MRSTSRRGLLDLLPRTQPRRSRACPLASHATAHVARVPSPRSPLLCPLTSHARTRALSALSLLAGTLSLSLRPRSALASRLARMLSHALSPRTQSHISHACPLCSQTRPLITHSHALLPSALSPRMRARVPSLLSARRHALSLSLITSSLALPRAFSPRMVCMPSHTLLLEYALPSRMHALAHALSPRTSPRVRALSLILSNTPSHYGLSLH